MNEIREERKRCGRNLIKGCLAAAVFFAAHSNAQSFCFASASSYYEQVYCELQAKGESKTLPPFYQFKRNDATTQALLLKRPAARIGIDLPMPKSSARKTTAQRPSQQKGSQQERSPQEKPTQQNVQQQNKQHQRNAPSASADNPHKNTPTSTATPSPMGSAGTPAKTDCQLGDNHIRCGEQRFAQIGNRRNQRLGDGVLDAENKMAIPAYTGAISDQSAVDTYLTRAYRQYIEKMHEIGLGGVTMTYGKFYFLFFDIQEKGLDFSQRFETMYGFLKKDKASMGVSETLTSDDGLKMEDCDPLAEHIWVCNGAGRNYLYMAESE